MYNGIDSNQSLGEMDYSDVKFDIPILFLVFNRLDVVEKVLEEIRSIRPSKLYISCDGPRLDRVGEAEQVNMVRNYVISKIDWECKVHYRFSEKNLGCRYSVSQAISWFFENEELGIILEDDCLPDPSFFQFCKTLLLLYKDDLSIFSISGNHFHYKFSHPPCDYFVSRYHHCWGWATWRRSWELYEQDMSSWRYLRDTDWLLELGNGSKHFAEYWETIFDATINQSNDSWAYRWLFSCWANNGLSIIPTSNLVKNIGFDDRATHTKNIVRWWADLPLESVQFPLVSPEHLQPYTLADKWLSKFLFRVGNRGFFKKIILRIEEILLFRLYFSAFLKFKPKK